MKFEVNNLEKILHLELSRRDLLALGLSIPLLNSMCIEDTKINKRIVSLIGNKGVISLAKIDSGEVIACSNLKKALVPTTIGSVAKIFTALALLDSKLVTENTYYNCKGHDIILGKVVKCWNESGHGRVNIEKAISKSCNLFFCKNIQELSINRVLEAYKSLALSNIEPLESRKFIDDKYMRWINNTYPKDLVDDIGLGLYSNMKLSQLQILSGICNIARGDIYYPLHFNTSSTRGLKLHVNKNNLSIVRYGMIKSVKEGTSKLLGANGYNAAAKTGTATNYNTNNGKNHGWCVGYIPYNKPKIAFSVMIENGTGYSDAVPYALKTLKLCEEFGYF